jgi:hypothetical protein
MDDSLLSDRLEGIDDMLSEFDDRLRKLEAIISGLINNAAASVMTNATTAPASPHAARMGQVVDEQLAQINARAGIRGRTR